MCFLSRKPYQTAAGKSPAQPTPWLPKMSSRTFGSLWNSSSTWGEAMATPTRFLWRFLGSRHNKEHHHSCTFDTRLLHWPTDREKSGGNAYPHNVVNLIQSRRPQLKAGGTRSRGRAQDPCLRDGWWNRDIEKWKETSPRARSLFQGHAV